MVIEHEAVSHSLIINKLEVLIRETQATINRTEALSLNKNMPDDYAHLLDILDKAIKQQRDHTLAMLKDDS